MQSSVIGLLLWYTVIMTRAQTKPQYMIILALSAAALFVAGAAWYGYNFWFTRTAKLTTANVINVISNGDTYHAVVQFTATNGVVQEATSTSGASQDSYIIGQPIEIYYFETNPQRIRLNDFVSLWFGPIMLGAVGLGDLVASAVLYRWLKRRVAAAQYTGSAAM
jgi:hypothetical protein